MTKTALSDVDIEDAASSTLERYFPGSTDLVDFGFQSTETGGAFDWVVTSSGHLVIRLLYKGRDPEGGVWAASATSTKTRINYYGCDWTTDVDEAVASLVERIREDKECDGPLFGAEHIVATLNQMLEADPVALTSLFSVRVPSSNELAHAWPEVVCPGDDHFLGLIGILNGIAGTVHADQPCISMSVAPSGTIEYFEFAVPDDPDA